jgi:hypothetical protein
MSTRRTEADLAVQSVRFVERAAPSTPPTGNLFAYAKADGLLYTKNDAGVETALGGGGGSDPWTVLELATDQVNSTTNTANVGIGFTAAANTNYLVQCYLPVVTAATTTGILLALGGPTSGCNYAAVQIRTPMTATTEQVYNPNGLNAYTTAASGMTTVALATIFALISVGPTPAVGDVRVLFKSEVATSAVTVKAGAVLMYRTL